MVATLYVCAKNTSQCLTVFFFRELYLLLHNPKAGGPSDQCSSKVVCTATELNTNVEIYSAQ